MEPEYGSGIIPDIRPDCMLTLQDHREFSLQMG